MQDYLIEHYYLKGDIKWGNVLLKKIYHTMFLPLCRRNTHLVLELLAELQGDGKEHQRIVEPRNHTLHLVDVAHLKPIAVELAVKETARRDQ